MVDPTKAARGRIAFAVSDAERGVVTSNAEELNAPGSNGPAFTGTVDDFKNAEAEKLAWLCVTELLPLLSVLLYSDVCETFY